MSSKSKGKQKTGSSAKKTDLEAASELFDSIAEEDNKDIATMGMINNVITFCLLMQCALSHEIPPYSGCFVSFMTLTTYFTSETSFSCFLSDW